jgi:hypothetical protein
MIARENLLSFQSIPAQLFLSAEVYNGDIGIISRINEVDQIDKFPVDKLNKESHVKGRLHFGNV